MISASLLHSNDRLATYPPSWYAATATGYPDTEQLIKGITLPDWQNVKDLVITSAYAIPALRLQAWDVALTNRGPVLLELNVGGDFVLPQVATGRPSMDPRFVDFLESCRR